MNIDIKSIGETLRNNKIDEWLFYAKLSGNHHATAFVLRRIIIWSATPTAKNRGGWFWKTHSEMSDETGLSEYQIKQAQKRLSKLVQVKVRRYKGTLRTYYRLKADALTRAIESTISRILGKLSQVSPQKTFDDLRKKLVLGTPKNLSRQSLTSYSNNQSKNNQTQTSVTPDANKPPSTAPPAQQTADDDLIINLPDCFKNYSFTGTPDIKGLTAQVARVGQKQAIATIEHCISKGGKSWQYMLTSLQNTETVPIPASSTKTIYGIGMQPPIKDDAQWIPGGNDKYADIIKR